MSANLLMFVLEQVEKSEVAFLAAAGAMPLVQVLLQMPKRPQGGLLLVGPEGGDFQPHVMLVLMGFTLELEGL